MAESAGRLADACRMGDDHRAALAAGRTVRLMAALESAALIPRAVDPETGRMRPARLKPSAQPTPVLTSSVYVPRDWGGWRRPHPYTGPAVVLDKVAAWVAAIGTVRVAMGALVHQGAGGTTTHSGLYLIDAHEWGEPLIPSPLPGREPGSRVWVAHPTAQLLSKLADAGRWPPVVVHDAWTYPKSVVLTGWKDHIKDLRTWVMVTHGEDSRAYEILKESYARAVRTMQGTVTVDESGRSSFGFFERSGQICQRPDWGMAIEAQHHLSVWWLIDKAQNWLPEPLTIITARNVDELVMPAAALDLLCRSTVDGKPPVLWIDHANGVRLGGWRTKGNEAWDDGGSDTAPAVERDEEIDDALAILHLGMV